MPLTAGARLGPYEIVSALGAGGMGEVYRARDTKLGRDVALKVIPDTFALDPDRLARFRREAQVLASLNHPHIAAIYGFEDSGETHALVLELVEGETLTDQIARGPIAVDEALPIGRQICEALEAAHEQGIIHRDLKPANIKVTPDGVVKVLDFGLAKLAGPAEAGHYAPGGSVRLQADLTMSPTITSPAMMTGAGMILGTAAYMAPEQAKGREADKRSDMWAFGCVLYEMLTAKRAFDGDDVAETLASVLKAQPDWTQLPEATPSAIATLLRRCLRKDRSQRLGDASAARIEIDDAIAAPSAGAVDQFPKRTYSPLVVMALIGSILLLIAVGVGAWIRNRAVPQQPLPVVRLTLPVAASTELNESPTLAVSPDGTQVAYVAIRGGLAQIYMRALDSGETKPLPGTEGASGPFFSPDGRWVAFIAGGKLKKISTSGGISVTLADAGAQGGSWGPNDTIVFRDATALGFREVPAAGGASHVIPTPDPKDAERPLQNPAFLPGGRAVLFASPSPDTATADEKLIGVLTLDTGERKVLIQGGSYPLYLPTGHLAFLRSGTLMAAPFDLARLEVTGPPIPVIEGVRESVTGVGAISCSVTGNCAYVPGGIVGAQRTVVLVDRAGAIQTMPLIPQSYGNPRFSPGGDKISFWIERVNCDVVVYDITRGALTRLTFDGDNHFPIWTPDGKRLTYISRKALSSPGYELFSRSADGSGVEDKLNRDSLRLGPVSPLSWSPDGQELAFTDRGDLWLLPLSGTRTPRRFSESRFNESLPAFSPDGRWLAYVSDESGRQEVYVQPFPGPGGKFAISTGGGTEPVWARSGRALFFRDGDRVMEVEIRVQPDFTASKPRVLFGGSFARTANRVNYDVSPDGQHFVMVKAGEQDGSASINVVLNWFEELKRVAPTK